MANSVPRSVAEYFGSQIRKERLKAGLSVLALAGQMEMDDGHLGRVERGIRSPSAEIAAKLDKAFPKREGWFSGYYEASRTWVPPAARAWGEHEDNASMLFCWSPTILDGLLQVQDYARALLETYPDSPPEIVAGRLAARMARQRRVLHRPAPPRVHFIVDELSLYRMTGSAGIMIEQLRYLARFARQPNVTVQVFPPVTCPVNVPLIVADEAAYAEHVFGGHTEIRRLSVSHASALFDSLRAECNGVSASLDIIERAERTWASMRTGARRPTRETSTARASRQPAATRPSQSGTPPTGQAQP